MLNFLPVLKSDGKILFVLKTGIEDKEPDFSKAGLEVLEQMNSEKEERYYLLKLY
jgi:hypothetical protein